MKFKRFLLAILVIIFALSAVGCQSSAYSAMRNQIKSEGAYNSEYKKYNIKLSDKVDYYFFEDSDSIWLNYYDYSSKYSTSFYISFNKDMDGEYYWSMRYDEYSLTGTLTASKFNKNTSSLYYSSSSKDSVNETVNSTLRSLSATLCKICILDLALYWEKTDFNLRLSDLGFDY